MPVCQSLKYAPGDFMDSCKPRGIIIANRTDRIIIFLNP